MQAVFERKQAMAASPAAPALDSVLLHCTHTPAWLPWSDASRKRAKPDPLLGGLASLTCL